jgi:MFS family permease
MSAERLQSRLVATILAAVMLGMLGVTWATQHAFQDLLRPELQRKAGVVGGSVGELVGKALDHGLALPELAGVPAHLDAVRREHHELAWIALRDHAGHVLFSSGRDEGTRGVTVPLVQRGRPVGVVESQVSDAWIRHILVEAALDLGVVFIVAIFLTRELLHSFVRVGAAPSPDPADGAPVLARLRLPLFLFMLAEESTRAFLPGHAKTLAPAGSALSPDLLAALPIVVFMLVVALGQPVLATWSERAGARRILLRGALLGVAGLAGAALATHVGAFVAWRALCGLGYGMVFVAGQGLVLQHTTAAGRTRGFALFVGAIMAAAVCGPPIGGMLAEHVGPRAGFALAAAIAATAWLAAHGLPRDAAGQSTAAPAAPAPRDYARVFAQGRFLWVTALAAVPAKLILAGSVFYLVPLYVAAAGASPAVAGRAMMLYAVALVLVLPHATHWVERGVPLARMVGMGLCVSALGGFALLAGDGVPPVYLVTALLGLGQGLSIAAQSSLLSQVCAREIAAHGSGPAFGAYRLLERLGNASGPIVAGAFALVAGPSSAFVAMAGLVLACGLSFLLLARRVAR